ncbi:hypothetical protein ACLOJK_027034 [Asimina triloba]
MVLHHHHGRRQPWLPPASFTAGFDWWIRPSQNDVVDDPILLWQVSPDNGDSTTAPTVLTTSSSSSADPSCRTSISQIRVVHRIADVELTSDPAATCTHPFRPSGRRCRPDPAAIDPDVVHLLPRRSLVAVDRWCSNPPPCLSRRHRSSARIDPPRYHPPPLSMTPARSIPSTSARSASAWHDHSSTTSTTDVSIDDAAFATVLTP